MTALCRIGCAAALALCVTGCATPDVMMPSAVVTSPRPKVIASDRVARAVAAGRSTKADVRAALGETLVISFDTGYEVWVYRLANDGRANTGLGQLFGSERDRTAGELVVLFAPSGVVAKTRTRPAP